MAVRTTRFDAASVAGISLHTRFTVPAGHVYIIKSVVVQNTSGVAAQFAYGSNVAGGSPNVDWYGRGTSSPLANGSSDVQQGWWAMTAGDQFYFNMVVGSPLSIWVSGADLS